MKKKAKIAWTIGDRMSAKDPPTKKPLKILGCRNPFRNLLAIVIY
jgi:hypothetical protein